MITREQMKLSHKEQIEAIMADDVEWLISTLEPGSSSTVNKVICTNKLRNDGGPLARRAWNCTGKRPLSLFSRLPNCPVCLTQMKEIVDESDDDLGLLKDDLIPMGDPVDDWNPTREVLQRFSELQIQARFGVE